MILGKGINIVKAPGAVTPDRIRSDRAIAAEPQRETPLQNGYFPDFVHNSPDSRFAFFLTYFRYDFVELAVDHRQAESKRLPQVGFAGACAVQ
jgi:hypothetical protein